ncbi:MAG: LCP family protein [Solirubrobacteraceae bacterium]
MRLIPATRGGSLLRFLMGSVLVVAFVAGATAVAGLLQFKQLAQDIGVTKGLAIKGIVIPQPGQPQTLLLIGSDHRAGDPYHAANTDTMMLMRLNANSTTINVMSIPRDLEVQIPQGGTTFTGKLNAAYSVGGPNLLLTILKSQVFAGQGFHVNHVIDVNFAGFSDLIDAIGCVYTDVDHRYYNNTIYTNYSSIDIQPGYQRMCGWNQSDKGALSFVRFRHTDSDIVRNARQQDFLRWAKQNYSGTQLFSNRDKLVKIFGKHAQTDITLHSADAIENLVVLIATSAGNQLKSIPFPAQLQPCGGGAGQTPCYVTASAAGEARVYREFMTPTLAGAKPSVPPSNPASGHGKGKGKRKGPSFAVGGLVADTADGRRQALALGRAGFPVYYPKLIQGPSPDSSTGAQYCSSVSGNCNDPAEPVSNYIGSYPRQYVIHAPDGKLYKSYRMTLVINSALGLYYGVQGTTWRDPPILKSPTQTQMVNGKQLLEYFNGKGRLSIVAWKTPTAVYWISNTLTDYIPPKQMVGMAASLHVGR